jgi:NAD(P)-dependent dehydrogenase (short-subunit alcohol dehydrogenase family)
MIPGYEFLLNNKVAIITGAGSGIGREIAREFARRNAFVVCAGRRVANLDQTVKLIESEQGHSIAVRTDVSQKDQVDQLVETTINQCGKIDILFNNAGSFRCLGPVWEVDPELWWRDVEINLLGTMLCCHAVLPSMINNNEGIIINMDGGGGTPGPNIGGTGYGSSKAAIIRFTESLAGELSRIKSNVLVFALNPGTVKTEMVESLLTQKEKKLWTSHLHKVIGTKDEAPFDSCAKASMKLLEIACKELAGRTFHSDTNFNHINNEKNKIKNENLYVFKWVTIEDQKEK